MDTLTIMVSSRCNGNAKIGNDEIKFEELRQELKKSVPKSFGTLGRQIKVWISEDANEPDGTESGYQECLKAARQADIVLVIYNGDAGWTKPGDGIGICHAEYIEALSSNPQKIVLVDVSDSSGLPSGKQHKNFQDAVTKVGKLYSKPTSRKELFLQAEERIANVLIRLTRSGIGSKSTKHRSQGAPLEWSRLSFDDLRKAIIDALKNQLCGLPQFYQSLSHEYLVGVAIDNSLVGINLSAVPASMSIAEAWGSMGRPFSRDHKLTLPKKHVGPIHVIGIHRSVTESQGRKLLGIDDCMVLKIDKTGVFVIDNIQKTQIVMLENCLDAHTTQLRLQNFFQWIESSGEQSRLVERAAQRSKILRTIASVAA